MLDLAARYPEHTVTLEGLSLRLRGVKGPDADALLAREVACEISDEAYWVHQSWWIPAQPASAEAMIKRLGAKLPPEAEKRVEWLQRVAEARKRANVWRALPAHEKELWVRKQGLRPKAEQPLQHQHTSIGYGLQLPVWGAFLDTGLGKTYIMAQIFQILKEQKGAGPFLVVAPKSLLREAWGADIERHTFLSWMDIGDPPAPEPLTKCPACGRDYVDKPVPKAHLKTHLKVRLDLAAASVLAHFKPTGDKDEDVERDKATKKALVAEACEPIWDKLYTKHPDLRAAGSINHAERVAAAISKNDVDVYVINPDRAKVAKDVLKARKFSMLAVDESSMMRAHDSQTTQALIDIGWSVPRRCAMSGTPRPNSNLELWGQFAMLDACFSHAYERYKQKYFQVDISGFHWLTRPGMDAKLADIIEERTLRFKLNDCVDLPPETTETREVDLSDEIRVHYATMLKDMIVQLDDDKVSTPYKLVQINKLAQITSGFIYDHDGKVQYLSDGNPKLTETIGITKKLVEEEGRSVVIWIRFSAVEAMALQLALGKLGVSVLVGGMSSDQIQKSSQDFKSGRNKVMVAHPLSAKFGHTWTHATACIFHSYDYSWENYYQAKHRIYRIGQKQPVTYINIVARKSVDRIIMKALERKEGESAVVIDRQFVKDLKSTL